jgi:hypothetical protein
MSVWQFYAIYYILDDGYSKLQEKVENKIHFHEYLQKKYMDEYVSRSHNLIQSVVLC